MRRASVLLLSAVVLLGTALMGGASFAAAQDATPPAEEGEGGSFEFIGYGEAEKLPAGPAAVELFRIVMEPAGSFPLDPADPSVGIVTIESGALTVLADTPLTVLHPVEDGEFGPDDFEQFAADEEFTMEEGDSMVYPANVGGEVRNDGEEDVSVLIANIEPLEEEGAATPVT